MLTRPWPAALIALLCATATSAEAADLFSPELIGAETFAETFTMNVDLGQGGYLQAQLAISNLGPGDGQGACRFLLIPRPGLEVSGAEKFDREQWAHDAQGPALKDGPCLLGITGDDVVFEAPLKVGKLVATMKAAPKPVRPPERRVQSGDAFYETEILVPWASVVVQADLPKVERKRFVGYGMLDHSRSTTLPADLASRWVRFRVLDPDQARMFLVRYPPKGGPPKAWAWRAGQPAPRAVGRVRVGKKEGSEAPRFRALAMVEGKTWKMTSGRLIHRYAPIEKHGMLGRIVGSVVGNPVTYTYVGHLEAPGEKLTGLMEVTVVP